RISRPISPPLGSPGGDTRHAYHPKLDRLRDEGREEKGGHHEEGNDPYTPTLFRVPDYAECKDICPSEACYSRRYSQSILDLLGIIQLSSSFDSFKGGDRDDRSVLFIPVIRE